MERKEKVLCEFCKSSFFETTILRHLSKNQACKNHYGSRFEELKKKKDRERKQQSRLKLGKKEELERQREIYAQNSSIREKKRNNYQEKKAKLAEKSVQMGDDLESVQKNGKN